jgi:hypothetical protein
VTLYFEYYNISGGSSTTQCSLQQRETTSLLTCKCAVLYDVFQGYDWIPEEKKTLRKIDYKVKKKPPSYPEEKDNISFHFRSNTKHLIFLKIVPIGEFSPN